MILSINKNLPSFVLLITGLLYSFILNRPKPLRLLTLSNSKVHHFKFILGAMQNQCCLLIAGALLLRNYNFFFFFLFCICQLSITKFQVCYCL